MARTLLAVSIPNPDTTSETREDNKCGDNVGSLLIIVTLLERSIC